METKEITLSNINEFPLQEIFNKISDHLLKQNIKSLDGGFCAYRNEDNYKCAVGCLISDNEYDPMMERISILGYIFKDFKIENSRLTLLNRLQKVHDSCEVEKWRYELDKVAEVMGLNFLEQ